MIGAIETGGTKILCGYVDKDNPRHLIDHVKFPTADPASTFAQINGYFDRVGEDVSITALGIASFGPVNVEPDRPLYGRLQGTPKRAWDGVDIIRSVNIASRIPTTFISDVSAAALCEATWGAARGHRRSAYATFGTGVGVGLVQNGELLHGNLFPEAGHMLVRRHPKDRFSGGCVFHSDCLEGMVSGPAIAKRLGHDFSTASRAERGELLPILGFYIGQFIFSTSTLVGTEKFVVGGGVLKAEGLFEEICRQLRLVTGGAGASHSPQIDADGFVARPEYEGFSGLFGAVISALGA
jgi:fructokinase